MGSTGDLLQSLQRRLLEQDAADIEAARKARSEALRLREQMGSRAYAEHRCAETIARLNLSEARWAELMSEERWAELMSEERIASVQRHWDEMAHRFDLDGHPRHPAPPGRRSGWYPHKPRIRRLRSGTLAVVRLRRG